MVEWSWYHLPVAHNDRSAILCIWLWKLIFFAFLTLCLFWQLPGFHVNLIFAFWTDTYFAFARKLTLDPARLWTWPFDLSRLILASCRCLNSVSSLLKWVGCVRALPPFYIEHGAHILEMTQHELFCIFWETHPEIVISECTFEACKPWFLRSMRERDTCCCRYHVEFQLLYDFFCRAPGFGGVLPSSPRDFMPTLPCERE